MTDPIEVLLNYLIFIGLFSVALIFLFQTRKHSRKAHELTLALFCGAFGQLFLTFGLFNQIGPESWSLYFKIIGMVIYSFLFVFMFLHYEHEHRITPSPFFLSILMILLGSVFTLLGLAVLNYGNSSENFSNLALTALYFLAFFVFSHSFRVSFKTSMLIPEKQQVMETLSLGLLLTGSIIYVTGAIFVETLTSMLGFNPILIGDLFVISGLFSLTINYLSNIDFLYRLPIPIHQIILFNEAGVSIYARKVQTKGLEHLNIQEVLFSGTVSAITSLLRETLGTQSRLRAIDAGTKQIFLETKGGLTGLVIADRGTKFLMRSLTNLMAAISPRKKEELNRPMIKLQEHEKDLDVLVKRAFPYVKITTMD